MRVGGREGEGGRGGGRGGGREERRNRRRHQKKEKSRKEGGFFSHDIREGTGVESKEGSLHA